MVLCSIAPLGFVQQWPSTSCDSVWIWTVFLNLVSLTVFSALATGKPQERSFCPFQPDLRDPCTLKVFVFCLSHSRQSTNLAAVYLVCKSVVKICQHVSYGKNCIFNHTSSVHMDDLNTFETSIPSKRFCSACVSC